MKGGRFAVVAELRWECGMRGLGVVAVYVYISCFQDWYLECQRAGIASKAI